MELLKKCDEHLSSTLTIVSPLASALPHALTEHRLVYSLP